MGPDETPPAGKIFYAPAGTPLPMNDSLEGWSILSEAVTEFSASMYEFGDSVEEIGGTVSSFMEAFQPITLKFDVTHFNPELHRIFFGGKQPKSCRKRFDRNHKRARKAWRLDRRAEQRRAIGIKDPR